jgi:predicted HicB family RNase H-like nuclease
MRYSLPSSSSSSSSEKKKKEDNDNNNNKDKLLHQGFRIQEQVIKALAEEAARKGISVSNLVNKILKTIPHMRCSLKN